MLVKVFESMMDDCKLALALLTILVFCARRAARLDFLSSIFLVTSRSASLVDPDDGLLVPHDVANLPSRVLGPKYGGLLPLCGQ